MQGTISTSQHIGLPGGSPICCEWKFPALSRHSPGTLNEPISKRRSKSRRLPKIRLTLSRTPRPKIRIKTTTLRNRKSRSRMPKQRTRPSSPSTAQLITSCSTNLSRRGILHRPASSILQSPPARPHGAGGPFCAAKSRPGVWGDRIFEKCGIGRDERGDGGKTLEIRGKRRLPARDGGANYQQS